jgi:hypothetical protein
MIRRTFLGLVAAVAISFVAIDYDGAQAQGSLKAIIVAYEFSEDVLPAGQLRIEIQYFTYGTVTSRGTALATLLGTDSATQIRTKILDAVVADVLANHKVAITKPDILLPTYAAGS